MGAMTSTKGRSRRHIALDGSLVVNPTSTVERKALFSLLDHVNSRGRDRAKRHPSLIFLLHVVNPKAEMANAELQHVYNGKHLALPTSSTSHILW